MKRLFRPVLAFVLILILPALACNLPVGPREGTPSPRTQRRTLEALLFPTLQALQATSGGTAAPFSGLATATPLPPNSTPVLPPEQPPPVAGQPYLYLAQSGDTLNAVAAHFGVPPDQITSTGEIPLDGLIPPGQPLGIPSAPAAAAYPSALLPDSEIVYGPSAADFDVQAFLTGAGGFLSTYSEQVDADKLTAAQIIQRVSIETSTNPRILLAVLEQRSGWVYGQPRDPQKLANPVGFYVPSYSGLWKELSLTVRELTVGYYGWRDGTLSELSFMGGKKVPISPTLNAGSVALQYLYTFLLDRPAWEKSLYGSSNLIEVYTRMFGSPWEIAAGVEPLFPAGLAQPELQLPITPGERWSMTGGPHLAWGVGSPRAAIDLAPVTGEPACQVSRAWALAAAPGLVVRSSRNALALDLDGDGREQTGWVIFYYHLAEKDRVAAGTRVAQDTPLGHPSCEGGRTTGTHFHIGRKYNGEWLAAGGPLPFVLGGWTVHAAAKPYEGTLTRGDQVVSARPDGEHDSIVVREP